MFLIQPDNEDRLLRVIQTASTLWGGMDSPIFPLYKELPDDYLREYDITVSTEAFYRNTVLNYDPDIVFYDEDLDIDIIKSFIVEREFISLADFIAALTGRNYDNCITVMEICRYILEDQFKYQRTDELKISIPKIKKDDLFLHSLCGSLLPAFEDLFLDGLINHPAFERPVLDWKTLNEYRNSYRIDIQELSYHELNSWLSNASPRHHECVYFLDTTRLRDIMNFWNLRAAGWTVIPLALDRLDNPYFAERLDKLLSKMVQFGNGDFVSIDFLILRRHDVGLIESAIKALAFNPGKYQKKVITPVQQWFPRFWAGFDESRADHIRSHQPYFHNEYRQYSLKDDALEITVAKLPFEFDAMSSRRHAYKALLEFSPENEQLELAGVLSGLNNRQLKSMLGLWTSNHFRLSDAGIFTFTRSNAGLIWMRLPSSIDFFNHYFSNLGHQVQVTSNSKLAKEVLRNMGGITDSRRFLSATRLKIIEGFENGKIATFDGLTGEIKKLIKTNNNDTVKKLISMLLTHKIIELGARIQCRICNQHGFYIPAQINDVLTCPICRNNFELPSSSPADIVWAYRGIGPFSRNNKVDGVMSVFATAFLMLDGFAGAFGQVSALFGFELNKKGQKGDSKEVDLCFLIGSGRTSVGPPDLVLCECKTYKRFEELDTERLRILGDTFPGAILVVATLNDSLNETEVNLISDLVKHFRNGEGARPRNSVLILTGKELLPEDFNGGLDHYHSKISHYQYFNDFMGSLCELTVETHLQVPTWSNLLIQRHTEEMARRKMVGAVVRSLLNYAENK